MLLARDALSSARLSSRLPFMTPEHALVPRGRKPACDIVACG